jgi:hypothetical protein
MRRIAAWVVVALGLVLIATGTFVWFGLGPSLIVAGIGVVALGIFAVDVEERIHEKPLA